MNWQKLYKNKAEYDADKHPDQGANVEAGHQIVQARYLVSTAISSGVIGEESMDWMIIMSGNATPAHQPAPDGTKEWLSVTITQK